MDKQTDWYLHPAYKAYGEPIRANWDSIRTLEGKVKGLFRDIFSLSLARDLVVHQTYKLEAIPSSHTKALEKYTTDCDECWFYNWSHGEECIQDTLIQKAVEIGRLKLDIDTLKAKNKELNKEQDEIGEKIRNGTLTLADTAKT